MSDGMTRSMCAHLCVKYNPIDHDNGSASDRWSCDLCGHDFWPKLWLFPAPWMRERPAEPKLPPSEKAELQVSLLNALSDEIRALGAKLDAHDGHLTAIDIASYEGTQRILKERGERLDRIEAMFERIATEIDHVASRYAEQAETLKTYKLSLEGIQGLLVDLEHSFDVIAEVQANSYDAVVTKFTHIQTRLTQIEDTLAGIKGLIVDSKHAADERWNYALRGQASQLKGIEVWERLVTRLDLILGVLGKRDSQVGRKPRKAGKRPAPKAGKRLKTSKL